jgi:hypothetical protein
MHYPRREQCTRTVHVPPICPGYAIQPLSRPFVQAVRRGMTPLKNQVRRRQWRPGGVWVGVSIAYCAE